IRKELGDALDIRDVKICCAARAERLGRHGKAIGIPSNEDDFSAVHAREPRRLETHARAATKHDQCLAAEILLWPDLGCGVRAGHAWSRLNTAKAALVAVPYTRCPVRSSTRV